LIEIFSTARSIREFYSSFLDVNGVIPKAITIAEFESKAWYVDNGFSEADTDTRVVLMQEAINFDSFHKLHIPVEFMAFLKNSNYIFRFFEELANEKVEIESLKNADIYAEFNEHISILEELYVRYEKLLESKKLYDKITLPKIAKINTNYLKSLKQVRIHIEGYLSKFECELIETAQNYCEVNICTPITKYNEKIKNWLESFGLHIKENTINEINLNSKKIINVYDMKNNTKSITTQPFSVCSLQVGFVFEQIKNMVKSGILPENIAVILPDESFAPLLKELDKLGNLNFAMGKKMSSSNFTKKINAILKYNKENNTENTLRVHRYKIDENFAGLLNSKISDDEAIKYITNLIDDDLPEDDIDIINEELFLFQKFLENLQKDLRLNEILTLFESRINKRSIDDVASGKVTVLGILETRGVSYEGIIIVDFNDDLVPKRSSKDMFLSSRVRAQSNLPSSEDRENLQRFFYDRAIKNAKSVSISYVENEERIASRFLKKYDVEECKINEIEYFKTIYKRQNPKDIFDKKELILKHNFFDKPLSANRLKNFLECPRRYFFMYIANFKECAALSDEVKAKDIGNILHDVLRELDINSLNSFKQMKDRAKELLHTKKQDSLILTLHCDVWLLKLEDFFHEEMKRKEEGWRVYATEKEFTRELNGVKITGRVDRIDKNGEDYRIYDYKTGKINTSGKIETALNSSDFQLEFYLFLCESLGKNIEAFYYKIDEAKLINDGFFEEKKRKLLWHIEELKSVNEYNFTKTEDLKKCEYCIYKTICRGEV
jgi:RecB family exonuclease